MANINDILARAAALRDETALNSISPERAGGIMYDTLQALNDLWLQQGSALVISKIYASVAAMEADTAPISDLTGQPLRPGQIVVIASSDSDNGTIYRYNGTESPSWSAAGQMGNSEPVDSLDSDSSVRPLAAHQGKVLKGNVDALRESIQEQDNKLEALEDEINGVPIEREASWGAWQLSPSRPHRAFTICDAFTALGGVIKVSLSSYGTYKIGVVIQNGTDWASSAISDTGWKNTDIEKTIAAREVGFNIRVSIARVDNASITLTEFLSVLTELSYTDNFGGSNGLLGRVEALENLPPRIPMEVLGGTTYVGKKVDVSEHSYTSEIIGVVGSSGQSRQGCAVYGDYLFQCFNTNNAIVVFKLSTGQTIQTIPLTANANNHANSAGFGGQKYNSSDPFPCLYISSEGEKKCYVYRITGTEGAFAVTLVQTLSYSNATYYYPNLHIDAPNMRGILVGYEANSWQSPSGNKMLCCCFDLPLPIAGDAILKNPYNEFSFPFIYATQGALGRYGKLYHAFGNTSAGLNIGGILIIDYILKNVETFVDLKGAGNFEPEGIGLWNDCIVVNSQDGSIRKLTF